MKKITKYSRKGKAQKRYEGTGWIIIMAILLCILVPLCLLSEAGIEVPDWIMILWLVVAAFVIYKSSGPLSWMSDYIHPHKKNKRDS